MEKASDQDGGKLKTEIIRAASGHTIRRKSSMVYIN
jgi:hypothetical protein